MNSLLPSCSIRSLYYPAAVSEESNGNTIYIPFAALGDLFGVPRILLVIESDNVRLIHAYPIDEGDVVEWGFVREVHIGYRLALWFTVDPGRVKNLHG